MTKALEQQNPLKSEKSANFKGSCLRGEAGRAERDLQEEMCIYLLHDVQQILQRALE